MHHTAFRAPPGRRVADDEPIRWRSGDSNPRTQSRPAFIHAKASRKKSFCSASALHDVASQAIKNLPHLQPMTVLPLNRSRWAGAGLLGMSQARRIDCATGSSDPATTCGDTSAAMSPRRTSTVRCGRCWEKLCPDGSNATPSCAAANAYRLARTMMRSLQPRRTQNGPYSPRRCCLSRCCNPAPGDR